MAEQEMANKIARQLFAMASRRRDKDLVQSLQNEKYQRTFSDEYLFCKKSSPRSDKIDAEQKAQWAALAAKGDGTT